MDRISHLTTSKLVTGLLITTVIVLSIDTTISQVADFLTEFTTSAVGIAFFVLTCAILIAMSISLFQYIHKIASEILTQNSTIRIAHFITLGAQFSLIAILLVIILQILVPQAYNTILLALMTAVTSISSAIVAIISSTILIGWFKINKVSYVPLLFGIAFLINAYASIYLGAIDLVNLSGKDQIITQSSEVVYSTDIFLTQPGTTYEILFDIYSYLSTGVFLLLVVGSALMLHHYAPKMGKLKFWVLLLLPLIYYASTLVDVIGIYIPVSDEEFFAYYVYSSLNGVIGGILLGLAFWVISTSLRPNKAVADYLRLCAFGFILHGVANVATIGAASYPPFGFASVSVLTLSTYIIILGLYSTAISISQDIRLRQFIKALAKDDSGFLSTIGRAQLEKQIQAKASDLENVVKEQRVELEKNSGVKSSVEEQDIKQYLLEVLQEVDKHKSTK